MMKGFVLPSHLNEKSPTKELQTFAQKIGSRVSGTKQIIWKHIYITIQSIQQEAEEQKALSVQSSLSRCFLSNAFREAFQKTNSTLITATTAKKQHLLSDKDLESIPCKLVKNPHYRSGPPMRLYTMRDILDLQFKKYANNLKEARTKRDLTTKRRNETRQQTKTTFYQRLQDAQVDLEYLVHYVPRFTNHDFTPSTYEDICHSWERLVELRTALVNVHLHLRTDSRLCCSYIDIGIPSLEYVVDMMKEMHCFFSETNYEELKSIQLNKLRKDRYLDWSEKHETASENAKEQAVRQWLKSHQPQDSPFFPERFL
jgi:hypothetical protein